MYFIDSTNSDRWMKALRILTVSMCPPDPEQISVSHFLYHSSVIVAASRKRTYLQSLQRCPVQNREINFYKGILEKKIKHLSIQKENIFLSYFPKQYANFTMFFFFITQQVYMHEQHLETLNNCTSVTFDTT